MAFKPPALPIAPKEYDPEYLNRVFRVLTQHLNGQSDSTAATSAADINNSAAKTSLVSADELGFWDSVTQRLNKITWANTLTQLNGTYEVLSHKNAASGYAGLSATYQINFVNNAGTFTSLLTNANTAARTYTFQDRNGTIADLTDIASVATTTAPGKIPTIGCTQAGGALTFSAASQYLDFRSTTAASGTVTTILAAPANLVLPSGGTLGFPTTVSGRILVAEINNAGTAELAIQAISGGTDVSETGVINTTAISAASTSSRVWYSTTARTGVAYRLVGAVDAVNTAGAWGSPTFIQGAGGNALINMRPRSMVWVNTANGYGSTNTKIRRFTNVATNQGGDITYADSATLGGSFTINVSGVYGISYTDQFSSSSYMGVSLNTTQPTVAIFSLAATEIVCGGQAPAANTVGHCGAQLFLPAGSIIRAHDDIIGSGTVTNATQFIITRVD